MVRPGSATVNSKGSSASAAVTRALRTSPTTGRVTRTPTSTDPLSGSATAGTGVSKPSPTTLTRVGVTQPVNVTRTTCKASGPTNNCVACAVISSTGMSALYVRGLSARRRTGGELEVDMPDICIGVLGQQFISRTGGGRRAPDADVAK